MDVLVRIRVAIDRFIKENGREPEAIIMHPRIFDLLNDTEQVIMFDFFSRSLYRLFGLEVEQCSDIKDFQLK